MPRPVSVTAISPLPSSSQPPGDVDAAAVGRVAHRVVDEVADRAQQLGLVARDLRLAGSPKTMRVPPGGQRRAPAPRPGRTAPTAHPAVAGGRGLPSSCASVSRSPTRLPMRSACCVISISTRFCSTSVSGRLRMRLEKARQHGQRRADLVRDVGDEVAPHRVGALALGHVLREHQLGAVAVAADRTAAMPGPRGSAHRDRLVEAAGLQVGDERRRADQVGDALAPVALRVEAEVVGGARVAPLDLVARVEQQHAVRRRLHRRRGTASGACARARRSRSSVAQARSMR